MSSEMPWVSAWRYAASKVFSPRKLGYWAVTIVAFIVLGILFGQPWPRAVLGAVVFALGMEVIEFVRRFLSGPPVGNAGHEP